ncbi:hypothetical protein G6F35_014199 [Rhizopus arrhizus]|nr:hypothetical protein G6F35_014199 [Rhizopus arrhizus]
MSACTLNSGGHDGAAHRDAHQPRGAGVLHHRQQRHAPASAARQGVQRRRQHQADQRNQQLQRIDAKAQPADLQRRLRQRRRQAARLFAEGEHHDVVQHDAERHRGHQPGVGAPAGERPHGQPFDRETVQRTQREGRQQGGRQRPAQRLRERIGQHGAQHHGAALGEVHRARHGVGQVKAQGHQSVHASQTQAADDGGHQQHARLPRERAVYWAPLTGRMRLSMNCVHT